MDVTAFFRSSRVLIVAGKGGVGRTTMVATFASLAARHGVEVVVAELEGKTGLAASFGLDGVELDFAGRDIAPGIRALQLTPDEALLEYLSEHGMRRVSKRLASSGVLDIIATAIPGIRDILVLGKIKKIEQEGAQDLVIVDAPATGHTLSFLGSARGLLDSARSGPVRQQAQQVLALLGDPARCQVVVVTLAEETPVNETVETAYVLEDSIGVKLGPVVVNAVYPDAPGLDADPWEAAAAAGVEIGDAEAAALGAAADFRAKRRRLQAGQLARLAHELPLPQIRLPELFTTEIGPIELDFLVNALAREITALRTPVAAKAAP